jgi:hypothetical protein
MTAKFLPCPCCGSEDIKITQECDSQDLMHWLSLTCQCGIRVNSEDLEDSYYEVNQDTDINHPCVEELAKIWNKRTK